MQPDQRTPINIVLAEQPLARAALVTRLTALPQAGKVAVIAAGNSPALNLSTNGSGCVCCVNLGDLAENLRQLYLQKVRQQIPDYERIIVAAEGNPASLLQTLMAEPLLAARLRLASVLALTSENPISRKQQAVADYIISTPTEITDEILEQGLWRPQLGLALPQWLDFDAKAKMAGCFILQSDQPQRLDEILQKLHSLQQNYGEKLWRLRGVVWAGGAPIVLQAVQHLAYPPFALPDWGSVTPQTRLLFCTDDLGAKTTAKLLGF